MWIGFSKLTKTAKATLAFFLFNITMTQIEWARDKVIPALVHHPKLYGVAGSLFGIAILLHKPIVQTYIKHMPGGLAIPAEPGAVVDDVKVITKP